MTLRYGSVCSGIEAASVAWEPLGWRPAFFSEVAAFPSAVLAHHYGSNMPGEPLARNGVPNYGDFTTIARDVHAPDAQWASEGASEKAGGPAGLDVLVGGTPCQSFSVAGLRGGLDDARGNLAIEFCRLADRLRPRWVLWENVPGVLSVEGGAAFGSIVGGLAELGYGCAWRVLDAQFVRVDGFRGAVPQRRRRVFVVGYLGDWRRAAAVLFERQSMSGHPPPRRQSGEGSARHLSARTRGGGGLGTDFDCDGGSIPDVSKTLTAARDGACSNADDLETFIPMTRAVAATLTRGAESSGKGGVAHTLRAEGHDASEDGSGRGPPLVACVSASDDHFASALCFDETQITSATNRCQPQPGDPSHPLAAGARPPTLAFNWQSGGDMRDCDLNEVTMALQREQTPAVISNWRVRRLMPVECERLQGFPDGYTDVPYRGKAAADGPRYKALGNSMAVNVMRWIGRRIEAVEQIG